MKLLAAREWNKVFTEFNQKHRIKVTAELYSLGEQAPHFSITRNRCVGCRSCDVTTGI
jgi:hypothetical protein